MSDNQEPQKQFSIQKIYVKDASFESPGTPQSFSFKQWDPKVDLNLSNTHKHVADNVYEAVLRVTATISHEDTTAFLVEIQQAGLFSISGFDDEERNYLLGSQCMNILFPFVREALSDLSIRGGFPPLLLSPVNFDSLYQQHLQQKQDRQEEAEVSH